jgi:endoglucanase
LTQPSDRSAVIDVLRSIAVPTAPYHEQRVLQAIRGALDRGGVETGTDEYGQVFAHVRRGSARQIVFMAHTDHPAFEVTSASGQTGRARVLGGFRGAVLDRELRVRVYDDRGSGPVPAVLEGLETAPDQVHNSIGQLRISAEGDIAPGQWAVLDLPDLEIDGEEIRMCAADDLAGCALIVAALLELSRGTDPIDAIGVFTRAEETGLYGARLLVEDALIARDATVVSVEASRALPNAPAGAGAVIRAGDLHNTFSNDAERYLRVAAEQLTTRGIATQRALLTGGTCEASTFVTSGFSTTAMALPNVNYHNRGPDERPAPEIVRADDLLSGVALAVEAAHAAASGARERWWDNIGTVPDEIRTILRRG